MFDLNSILVNNVTGYAEKDLIAVLNFQVINHNMCRKIYIQE